MREDVTVERFYKRVSYQFVFFNVGSHRRLQLRMGADIFLLDTFLPYSEYPPTSRTSAMRVLDDNLHEDDELIANITSFDVANLQSSVRSLRAKEKDCQSRLHFAHRELRTRHFHRWHTRRIKSLGYSRAGRIRPVTITKLR